MRDKVIEIIRKMRAHAAIEDAIGGAFVEKRLSSYLNDYAGQLASAIGYVEDGRK